MKKKLFALTILPALAFIAFTQSAYAFGGQGYGEGLGQGFGRGQGMHGMRGVDGLIPAEMREEWREDCANLTSEEREALREEHRASREARRAEMEEFVGLSKEEMREARQSGETMADILEDQGITEDDAEEFLTQQANDKVDSIVERHDLDEDDEKTLRDRIADFVQKMLERWYN